MKTKTTTHTNTTVTQGRESIDGYEEKLLFWVSD